MSTVRFNDALRIAARLYQDASKVTDVPIYLIRDVYGRIGFAVNATEENFGETPKRILSSAPGDLGAFSAPKSILFRDDLYDFDGLINPQQCIDLTVENESAVPSGSREPISIRVIDRQIIGQEWQSNPSATPHPGRSPRIVFFSFKGGVGRSTALSALSFHLAGQGKRVLLLDFDLESPGLSSLLLPPERAAPFGIVDWFVEGAVSQEQDVLREMVATSPLSDSVTGLIRVASAAGFNERDYIAKLSRVYADVPGNGGARSFASRMVELVESLEQQEKPDVVLIDSRAGLHDLAAVSIVSLADLALLFGTNSEQTWQGYLHLFRHWQASANVARRVRERLQIVYGLFPETDQQRRLKSFLRSSWDLFRDTLYDEIEPQKQLATETSAEIATEQFSFDESDQSAPHYPWLIRWNQRFLEFNPLTTPAEGGLSAQDIQLVFGQFLGSIGGFLQDLAQTEIK